ncbi:MAG: DUF1963 domain-containing protein [Leptolyngbya sp. SIO1D8]|nr:DUF1963 domain-containing protein [Leptolyngbya sp. SIO1D8]
MRLNTMHAIELEKHELGAYRHAIETVSQPCIVGSPSDANTDSYFGGMPTVDRDFTWPLKNGYPLDFVGQLKCSELDLLRIDTGYLLFFYDNRHWGDLPKDHGHAVVLRQHGERQANESDLPECDITSLFGLLKRTVKPKVYAKVNVTFENSCSYPSWERQLISFDSDLWEEEYMEFCYDIQPLIQLGGYPCPIQSDTMEQDCINAIQYGQPQDWRLLLQLFEVGDMMWGDAGALYWFIHKDDLHASRFDRVWMVSQCH